MDKKYIMLLVDGAKMPIVFNGIIYHVHVAKGMQHALHRSMSDMGQHADIEVVSAGFVDGNWNAYGQSDSLKLKSAEGDSEVIKKFYGK